METKDTKKKNSRKKKERHRQQIYSLLQGFFLGLFLCLLVFGVWKLASAFLGGHSGEKEYAGLRQYVLQKPVPPSEADPEEPMPARVDFESLLEINPETLGWIEIPDTNISYPLVHTSDNLYYLSHTFQGEDSKTGTIFLETSNKTDFSDLHTIIYGYGSNSGAMFGNLKKYAKKRFYEKHPYIYVDLPDGAHCYEIFSCHSAEVTDISYTIGYAADNTYASFLDSVKASSLYDTGVEITAEDSVLSLSTYTKNSKKRFVIHAKKLY